jgi:hypothetical protein
MVTVSEMPSHPTGFTGAYMSEIGERHIPYLRELAERVHAHGCWRPFIRFTLSLCGPEGRTGRPVLPQSHWLPPRTLQRAILRAWVSR